MCEYFPKDRLSPRFWLMEAVAVVAMEAACVSATAPAATDIPVAAPAIVSANPRRFLLH